MPKNKIKYLKEFIFSGLFGVVPTMKSAIPMMAIDKNKIRPERLVYLSPKYPAPTVVTPFVAWLTVLSAPIVVLLNPRLVAITGRIADLKAERYKCLKVCPEIIVVASLKRPWFTSKLSDGSILSWFIISKDTLDAFLYEIVDMMKMIYWPIAQSD